MKIDEFFKQLEVAHAKRTPKERLDLLVNAGILDAEYKLHKRFSETEDSDVRYDIKKVEYRTSNRIYNTLRLVS